MKPAGVKSASMLLAVLMAFAMAATPSARGASQMQAGKLDGKALYHEKCAMCHDKAGMGTGLLARRLKVAELTLRPDLNADFVFQAARAGIGNMPAIPRGEASDAQLKAIARFLATPPEKRK